MKKHLFRLAIFLLILIGIDWGVSGILRIGMERYYGIGQNADILIIGHSHLMKTCNKDSLEKGLNMKIAKYCREGVLVRQRYAMVQHYLDQANGHTTPYVLYGVDPLMFRDISALSHNLHKIFYPFMETESMDSYVRASESFTDYMIHKYVRCSRFDDTAIYRSARGWMGYWESLAEKTISDEEWNKPRPWKVHMPEQTVQTFHDTLDLLIKNGSHVILIYPSTIKSYETTNPEAYAYMMNYFQSLANSSPHIDFLNYAPLISHHQEYFEDSTHINRKGEKVLTQHLIRDLKEIINRQQPGE